MPSKSLIVILDLIMQVCTTKPIANRSASAQNSASKVQIDDMIHKSSDHRIQVWPLQFANLDGALLLKPGHLAFSHIMDGVPCLKTVVPPRQTSRGTLITRTTDRLPIERGYVRHIRLPCQIVARAEDIDKFWRPEDWADYSQFREKWEDLETTPPDPRYEREKEQKWATLPETAERTLRDEDEEEGPYISPEHLEMARQDVEESMECLAETSAQLEAKVQAGLLPSLGNDDDQKFDEESLEDWERELIPDNLLEWHREARAAQERREAADAEIRRVRMANRKDPKAKFGDIGVLRLKLELEQAKAAAAEAARAVRAESVTAAPQGKTVAAAKAKPQPKPEPRSTAKSPATTKAKSKGKGKSKVEQVESTQDRKSQLVGKLSAMTVRELKELCRQKELQVSGLKMQLVERLVHTVGAERS